MITIFILSCDIILDVHKSYVMLQYTNEFVLAFINLLQSALANQFSVHITENKYAQLCNLLQYFHDDMCYYLTKSKIQNKSKANCKHLASPMLKPKSQSEAYFSLFIFGYMLNLPCIIEYLKNRFPVVIILNIFYSVNYKLLDYQFIQKDEINLRHPISSLFSDRQSMVPSQRLVRGIQILDSVQRNCPSGQMWISIALLLVKHEPPQNHA